MLKKAGFKVKEGVSGMPTAFVAEYGSGKPIIGILAEYDALPELSQEAGGMRKPVAGRNDRATAAATAPWAPPPSVRRLAVKEVYDKHKLQGHHPRLRHAGRGDAHRQGLHDARRAVQATSTPACTGIPARRTASGTAPPRR